MPSPLGKVPRPRFSEDHAGRKRCGRHSPNCTHSGEFLPHLSRPRWRSATLPKGEGFIPINRNLKTWSLWFFVKITKIMLYFWANL